MAYSPWGEIQNKLDIANGIKFVSTAGHGGLMIKEKLAINMPSIALKKAIYYSGYYCFEEDLAYAIPVFLMNIVLPATTIETAKAIVKDWFPEVYEAFTKSKLNVKDSYVLRKRKHIEDVKDKMVAVAARSYKDSKVIVTACKGGRKENGQYNDKTKDFIVSSFDYDERRHYEFNDFVFEEDEYPIFEEERKEVVRVKVFFG